MTAELLNSGSASKLKWSIELVIAIKTRGGDKIIPEQYQGTSDRILTTDDLGLPDIHKNWGVKPLDPSARNNEKIIVYTTFAKFHPYLIAVRV